MVDFLLLETGGTDNILNEADTAIQGENTLSGHFLTLYGSVTASHAGIIGSPTRTFVISKGRVGDVTRELADFYQDAVYLEASKRPDQVRELIPAFVELWTPNELDVLTQDTDANIEAQAVTRLQSLDFIDGIDQFLFFGPIQVIMNLHKAILSLSAVSYKQIKLGNLFDASSIS